MRRAGACPRRPRWFPTAPTKFHRPKTFPLGGRWQPEGLTDEGRQRKIYHQRQKIRHFRPSSGKNQRFFPASTQGEAFFLRTLPSKQTLSAQCAHWAPLPKGEARRRAAADNSSLLPWQ